MTDRAALDDTDRQIVELLRQDARRTISDIASLVNLSPAPVKRRIDRLEQLGVIAGYTVVLNHAKLGPSVDAFVELRMAGNAGLDEITATVSEIPEVREVFTVAGDPDALVRIRLEDVGHLKDVVNALRRSGRVTGTKTLMVLDHWSRAGAGQTGVLRQAVRSGSGNRELVDLRGGGSRPAREVQAHVLRQRGREADRVGAGRGRWGGAHRVPGGAVGRGLDGVAIRPGAAVTVTVLMVLVLARCTVSVACGLVGTHGVAGLPSTAATARCPGPRSWRSPAGSAPGRWSAADPADAWGW